VCIRGEGGIEISVGDAVIDGAVAGAAGIGEPCDLDGCGFLREEQGAVVGHVHGEVDEYVDLVGADFGGELFVGKVGDLVPGIGRAADARGDVIGAEDAGVAMDFKEIVVVGFKEREGEEGFCVVEEVGRDIADAQATVRIARVGMRGARGGEREDELLVPAGLFLMLEGEIGLRVEDQGVEKVAMRGGVPGIDGEGSAQGGKGLIVEGEFVIEGAQVHGGFGECGVEVQGLAVGGDGLVVAVLEMQDNAQMVVGLGAGGMKLDGALIVRGGLGEIASLPLGVGKIQDGIELVGIDLEGVS